MRIVVAPDKFRGTVSAVECAEALAAPLRGAGHDVVVRPMADGGEGTLDALGGPNRRTVVTGPNGDAVEAEWRYAGRSAVIEMARASGLALVGGAEGNDAVAASTHGTGELIAAALDAGANDVIVGVGGSATTDGGLGALRALYPVHRLRGVSLTVACDVRTRFVDAARDFAPQKGASPTQVKLLERRLERLQQVYLEEYGVDVSDLEGAGAAGGLAGGLACVGGELLSGFDLVAERLALDADVEGADLVVTGEGFLDEESFEGKVVGGMVDLARHVGVPVVAVVGECFDGADALVPTVSLTSRFGRERAMTETAALLAEVALELPSFAEPG
ncbi:glycerate kinase family protein [Dermatobacter hominis]|uniref:glycerate kinase family protein n=1 Tax=Dermatobacter hominis TaxID=2884263 RepID=UPI001D1207EA|nr:glycerate kinase [Dermatobacter hominis]UDY34577.1 glycerate kinase [Dermatobacter hominis]